MYAFSVDVGLMVELPDCEPLVIGADCFHGTFLTICIMVLVHALMVNT